MHESDYRIVFGVLWVVFFAVRLYFQSKVKQARENYTCVNEKRELFFFRLFALAYLLLPLYVLGVWSGFTYLPLPDWVRWVGAAVTILGIGLFGWAHHALGVNWTAVLALSENHELVTRGPYRIVRHPMYTAFFVIGFGFLLLSANWLVGLIYLGTSIVMYLVRIKAEEQMMLERFGDAYREYMKTTGSIFPKIAK